MESLTHVVTHLQNIPLILLPKKRAITVIMRLEENKATVNALKAQRARLLKKLTDHEKRAIEGYSNLRELGAGFAMNALLRNSKILVSMNVPVGVARQYITDLDSAMAKAPSFPTARVKVLYRGVGAGEVSRWKPGQTKCFKTFLSTSFEPAHAFMYKKCCVVVIRSAPGASAKFVYAPREEELILDRLTKLRLQSVREVTVTPAFWKHPAYPLLEQMEYAGSVTMYDAVVT